MFSKSSLSSSWITCLAKSASASLNYLPAFLFFSPPSSPSSPPSPPAPSPSAFFSNIEPVIESTACSCLSISWCSVSAAKKRIFLSVSPLFSKVWSASSHCLALRVIFEKYTPVEWVYSLIWSETRFKSFMIFSLLSRSDRNASLLSVITLTSSLRLVSSSFNSSLFISCSLTNSVYFLNWLFNSLRLLLLLFWFSRWFAI